nr:RecName: Full=Phyllokinin; Contains: RecName: Full=Bradykinin [Phyllomedusa sauvagii]P86631.1 RecName: Full=Phyllokinin [Phasmahyla jandaia]Q7LZ52.1 RecName: Full=Phyllokinin; AltName: Full=Bradykinyl-isoleucyl-tyrosine O-sulfate [Pithecopus rohdei]prf//660391A phyllokinin [Pithecopus rohdei]
RPPGFSPFRIY